MIFTLADCQDSIDDNVVKLPYQVPQLTVLAFEDTQNNAGFSSDAGLDVSGS